MPSRTTVVGSTVGLHARPAVLIAAAAAEYDDEIVLTVDGLTVDAASSLLIMTLGAELGAEVTVSSENGEAVDRIAGLIAANLDAPSS